MSVSYMTVAGPAGVDMEVMQVTADGTLVQIDAQPFPAGRGMTFSAWCRAAQAAEVELIVLGQRARKTVGTAWDRVTVSVAEPEGQSVLIRPLSETPVLFCMAQLEQGAAAASDWRPAPEDVDDSIDAVAAGVGELGEDLDAVQAQAEAAMGAVRGLAVGGVNLVNGSANVTITGTDVAAQSYRVLASALSPGTVYTLSMASAILVSGSAAGMTLEAARASDGTVLFTRQLDFSGGKQRHTFATAEDDSAYELRLYAGVKGATNGVTVAVTRMKLEAGTFATDWTKSQADAEAELADLRSRLEVTRTGLESVVTHVQNDVDGTVRNVNNYFRFDGSDPGNPKLILGSTDSAMKMELTNSRLSFLFRGSEVAYFSDNKLYVTNVEAIQRLSVGTAQNGYLDIVTTATGVGFLWRS